jgi:hypothetical protein
MAQPSADLFAVRLKVPESNEYQAASVFGYGMKLRLDSKLWFKSEPIFARLASR